MKIRLHGTLEEVTESTSIIKKAFHVVSISRPYKDRGESELYRVYIEARKH
jgi:hypothetical protein